MDVRRAERRAARGDTEAAASLLARRMESGALRPLHVELAARLGHSAASKVAPVQEEWHVYDVLAALREAAVKELGTEARRLWFDAVRRFRADVVSSPRLVELALEGANWCAPGGSTEPVRAAFEAVRRDDRAKALLACRVMGEAGFRQSVSAMFSAFRRDDPEGSAALAIGHAVAQTAQVRSHEPRLTGGVLEDRLENPYDLALLAEYVARALSGRGVDPSLSQGARVIAATGDVAGCYGSLKSIEREGADESFFVVPLGRCAGCMTLGFRQALRVSERLEETKRQRAALAGVLLSPPPAPR